MKKSLKYQLESVRIYKSMTGTSMQTILEFNVVARELHLGLTQHCQCVKKNTVL